MAVLQAAVLVLLAALAGLAVAVKVNQLTATMQLLAPQTLAAAAVVHLSVALSPAVPVSSL